MKQLSLLIVLSILVIFSDSFGWAGEFTGAGKQVADVLAAHQLPVGELERQGLEVRLGEFTGAGRGVPFRKLRYVVTESDVIESQSIDLVSAEGRDLRPIPTTHQLHQVQRFEAFGQAFGARQVKAIVISR
jgi:hypothetical protein